MPPKRKNSNSHSPAPRPDAPRRSNRRVKESSDAESLPANGIIFSHNEKGRDGSGISHGVHRVMQDLGEMEKRFQNAVRRQRLAVENSDLGGDDAEPKHEIIEKEQLNATKAIINEKDKDQTMSVEHAPLDGYEADLAEGDIVEASVEDDEVDRGAGRRPAVNSDALPLPWTGRLGYACLNTYLRTANPPVFSSRTCRISSIVEHRHPLEDPTQPEHPTRNRPDKTTPPDVSRGLRHIQNLGITNARDIIKMIRWNEKYGIKFMRLSSEMFPFASHEEHGYRLAPIAADVLAETGKVAAELGHRLTTHPGQFTQIGSPREEVVRAAVRDLEYHDEMLSLLKLPEQMDRDAVMILHMGGTYGDKASTLDRFRKNYKTLSDGIKKRLVLENDDVAWSVHDLLPICEELNIPLVLDFHHHNIIFDSSLREGTQDIIGLFDRIRKTWTRKGIRQKMHYSEQTAAAITTRERRKHSARVKTLPPCSPDMDLMIEAKDKEQAVFELMRTFKLPGWHLFHDIVPFERDDESRKAVKKKKPKKRKKKNDDEEEGNDGDDIEVPEKIVSAEEFGMGGPDDRVYWPEGMEEWLRPEKREVKKRKNAPN